jgi:valyl-tRNA synthetase
VPEKPSLDGLEDRWSAAWEAQGTYRFDRTKARADVYSIDTPPSGTSSPTPTPTSSRASSG